MNLLNITLNILAFPVPKSLPSMSKLSALLLKPTLLKLLKSTKIPVSDAMTPKILLDVTITKSDFAVRDAVRN